MRDPVKGKTDAGRRREQRAWQTRQRIVDAALALFLERGYPRTTVEVIAQAAGVAPATVYQAFGTKQAILSGALDRTMSGDAEPRTLLQRDWVQQAREEPDIRRRLRIIVEHTAEVAARTAQIKEVMRDAGALEPAVRDLIEEDHRRRRRTQRALVAIIFATSEDDDAIAGAAETYFMPCNSYSFYVAERRLGWSVARWREWLVQTLTAALLPAPDPQAR
jgi:AcrR family transcriptional regulator